MVSVNNLGFYFKKWKVYGNVSNDGLVIVVVK